jgi:hypothetical protein
MARDAGVKVEGVKELRKSLKAAGHSIDDLKASHKEAATIAARASADLAPRVTGRLQRNSRAAGTATAGIVRAGNKAAPYAAAIHWGRAFWPNKKHPRRTRSAVRGALFISEGARSSEGKWLPVYERALDDSIRLVKGL